jgi:hypothetical protein
MDQLAASRDGFPPDPWATEGHPVLNDIRKRQAPGRTAQIAIFKK